jgi:hypothetical protein
VEAGAGRGFSRGGWRRANCAAADNSRPPAVTLSC